jgi:hypothetical protein
MKWRGHGLHFEIICLVSRIGDCRRIMLAFVDEDYVIVPLRLRHPNLPIIMVSGKLRYCTVETSFKNVSCNFAVRIRTYREHVILIHVKGMGCCGSVSKIVQSFFDKNRA